MGEINGLIRAAKSLHYWERRQEIAANNLANSETTGFKKERVFARIMGDQMPVADTMTDLSGGALSHTGEPLDLALADEAFFVVQTPEGNRLSRGGSFTLDSQNRIVDSRGNPLLGDGGEIVLPNGSVDISAQGVVRVDGNQVAQLRVQTVPQGTQLEHVEGSMFVQDANAVDQPAAERQVKQGHLEASNVNTVESLVDMIAIQRNFSAVQRAVVTLDEIRGTISNELGKPV